MGHYFYLLSLASLPVKTQPIVRSLRNGIFEDHSSSGRFLSSIEYTVPQFHSRQWPGLDLNTWSPQSPVFRPPVHSQINLLQIQNPLTQMYILVLIWSIQYKESLILEKLFFGIWQNRREWGWGSWVFHLIKIKPWSWNDRSEHINPLIPLFTLKLQWFQHLKILLPKLTMVIPGGCIVEGELWLTMSYTLGR